MSNGRVYDSFYDVPFDSDYGVGSHQKPRLRFSHTEVIHLLISVSVLTIAFSLAFSQNMANSWSFNAVIFYLPRSLLAIVTAFVCHELAHKYMGQKYGFWSEFRMFPQGLLLALVLSVFGFVFAAPGAVQIYGTPGKKAYGHISVAGPLTNMVISVLFIGISFIFGSIIGEVAFFIGYINIFLALFNLLPFGPLDGRKVMSWRFDVWIILFISCIVIFVFFLTGF